MPTTSARVRGVSPISRGQLHHLLTNPLYIGRIRHKDQSYPGQHAAIIDDALWQDVQAKLIDASARPRGRCETITKSRILTGKLRDETGDLLTPTFGNALDAATGQDANFLRDAIRFGNRYLPGGDLPIVGLAVDRLLIDRLVLAIDGETIEGLIRYNAQARKRRENDTFWLPGTPTPGRAPDFSKIIGGK